MSGDVVLAGAQVEDALTIVEDENKSDNNRIEQLKHEQVEKDVYYSSQDRYEKLLEEYIELVEALQRQKAIQTADQISATEIKLIIPKEKFQELLTAIQRSKELCYLTFDNSRAFLHADPDIFVRN